MKRLIEPINSVGMKGAMKQATEEHKSMIPKPKVHVDIRALESAAKRIYEDKGDRKGIDYIGWNKEPERVKKQWRKDVEISVKAYLEAERL